MDPKDADRLWEISQLLREVRSPALYAEMRRLIPQAVRRSFPKGVAGLNTEAKIPDATLDFMVQSVMETDRGVVLVAAAHLDAMLADLLRARRRRRGQHRP